MCDHGMCTLNQYLFLKPLISNHTSTAKYQRLLTFIQFNLFVISTITSSNQLEHDINKYHFIFICKKKFSPPLYYRIFVNVLLFPLVMWTRIILANQFLLKYLDPHMNASNFATIALDIVHILLLYH